MIRLNLRGHCGNESVVIITIMVLKLSIFQMWEGKGYTVRDLLQVRRTSKQAMYCGKCLRLTSRKNSLSIFIYQNVCPSRRSCLLRAGSCKGCDAIHCVLVKENKGRSFHMFTPSKYTGSFSSCV